MVTKSILVIAILLLVSFGGFYLWQKNSAVTLSQQTTTSDSTRLDSDHSLEKTVSDDPSFIEDLRKREFTGGEIKTEETLSSNSIYTSYLISYPSDDLTIYGVMNVPQGNGPFPVIILNHGYYNPSSFTSGDGTEAIANILASNGYLTLASDYRGHGKSENDNGSRGGHRPEYAIDVLNLIASVKTINKADENRIGMWGHSMGGEVSLRTIEATDKVKAVVLWAPTLGGGHSSDPSLMDSLTYIKTPLSLHQGLSDTEVDPQTSIILSDALKKEGKQLEYFEYEGQDHNFRNLGWDLISERTSAFFDKYLK